MCRKNDKWEKLCVGQIMLGQIISGTNDVWDK